MRSRGPELAECQPCHQYLIRREHVLVPEILRVARARDIKPTVLFDRYMTGVHDRHVAGLSIEVESAVSPRTLLREAAGRFAALMTEVTR